MHSIREFISSHSSIYKPIHFNHHHQHHFIQSNLFIICYFYIQINWFTNEFHFYHFHCVFHYNSVEHNQVERAFSIILSVCLSYNKETLEQVQVFLPDLTKPNWAKLNSTILFRSNLSVHSLTIAMWITNITKLEISKVGDARKCFMSRYNTIESSSSFNFSSN